MLKFGAFLSHRMATPPWFWWVMYVEKDFVAVMFLTMVGVSFVELGLRKGPEADAVGFEIPSRLINVAVASVSDV